MVLLVLLALRLLRAERPAQGVPDQVPRLLRVRVVLALVPRPRARVVLVRAPLHQVRVVLLALLQARARVVVGAVRPSR